VQKVAIIGGGVIGLTLGYELRKRGIEVVLVDKGEPGTACSAGNAGWVTPSLSQPIAAPGLTLQSLLWLLQSDSPLHIKPTAVPRLAGFLKSFRSYCNASAYAAGSRALAALNRPTLDLFKELASDGVSFEVISEGILYAFSNEEDEKHAREDAKAAEKEGLRAPAELSASAVHRLEPNLKGPLSGGLLFEDELCVRPESMCKGLLGRLHEMGSEVRTHCRVTSVEQQGTEVMAVQTDKGSVEADAFVIAAGAWSGQLASEFGYRLPVQAGKGYSITIETPTPPVSRAVLLSGPKIALSPFNGSFRVAGTMELSGVNLKLEPRRIRALERAAQGSVENALEGSGREDWVGMRPITPDGLPIIGALPSSSNTWVATGHSLLGLTLAPSTARCLAESMTGQTPTADLGPFDPARF